MAAANLRAVQGGASENAPLPGIADVAAGDPPRAVAAARLARTPRILVAVASLLLIGAYFFPLWSVRLTAPQYPEGLGMHIRINAVEGATENDLNNINNLNHYIGMKRIDPQSIPELGIMPWIVAAVIATGLGTAALGRRKVLYVWTGAFLAVAVIGLIDFWKWEYVYGHNLDNEHAILKIPGMTYQPPLIGAKQLLNFRATSWPSTGGILVGIAIGLAVLATVLAWRQRSRSSRALTSA